MGNDEQKHSWILEKCQKCGEYSWEDDVTEVFLCKGKVLHGSQHNYCGGEKHHYHKVMHMCSVCKSCS